MSTQPSIDMTEKYAWVDILANALYYAHALTPQNVDEMDAMGILVERYSWADESLQKAADEEKTAFEEQLDEESEDEALLVAKHSRTRNQKRKRTEDADEDVEDGGGDGDDVDVYDDGAHADHSDDD